MNSPTETVIETRRPRATVHLLVVGAVLYLVAWFVPVWKGQDALGPVVAMFESLTGDPGPSSTGLPPGLSGPVRSVGPDWLPGVHAVQIAWNVLVGDGMDGERWRRYVVGSTCFTNLVMLAALFLAVARHRSTGLALGLLGCAVWNGSWLYLAGEKAFDFYSAGYYLWLGSFAFVGLGLFARGDE
jgi:hypothetical protein